MTTIKQTTIILLLTIALFACQSSDEEKLLAEKEKELLQKENELLKKELGQTYNSMNTSKADEKQFTVDQALVKAAFMKYLSNISGGRKLSTSIIKLGDLNGDNLIDAVVDYGLEPTYDDNGGGGNAIGEIPSLVAFINTGQALTIADHSEEFGGNFGSRNELKKINNGVIFLEGLEYTDDDPRCCPSLKTKTKIVLRNSKLVKL